MVRVAGQRGVGYRNGSHHRVDGDTGARNKNAAKKALPAEALKPNEAPATESVASKALLAAEALAKSRWP